MSARDEHSMAEAELAEHLYQHRDDLAGAVVASRTPTRLDVMVSARFNRDEVAALRAAAEQAGLSLSAYLRQVALAATTTNVVDLDRVRQDVARMRELAADALRTLA